MVVMPFLCGMPWVPKFKGETSDVKFLEWKAQIEAMLRSQILSEAQKCDFILGALEAEAKREILILSATERATAAMIFKALFDLYGDRTPLAVLRSLFYDCRQQPREAVRRYLLRLRELGHRLQGQEMTEEAPFDKVIRDQFLMGLRDGSLKQELKRMVRRIPTMPFKEVREEALMWEGDSTEEVGQATVCTMERSRETNIKSSEEKWKQAFREELRQEMIEQIQSLGKTLADELHAKLSPMFSTQPLRPMAAGGPSIPRREESQPAAWSRTSNPSQRPNQQHNSRPHFQWDEHGKPVCNQCGLSGHIARFCRAAPGPSAALN